MTRYTITAGSNATDLGRIGYVATLLGAKRIGRRAVREMLPGSEGFYTVYDISGRAVAREECTLRTGREFVQI